LQIDTICCFVVSTDGKKQDLLGELKPVKMMGNSAWEAVYPVERPGVFVFLGIVKMDAKPAPFAETEVEDYNRKKIVRAQTDCMVTQTIKADGNGVFTHATPGPGRWGLLL
jgi:hypothetical protein